MPLLTEKYAEKIDGILSCYDRIIITGTLPGLCYAGGMTTHLNAHGIRIFDYPRFAEPFRDQLRENAESISAENQLEIEFIKKIKQVRKEDRIQEIITERGDHPGLVHIFSALETCNTYKPWHNKQSGQTYLLADTGKCLHYYFYFIDEEFGLCYLRVPTWAPFKLQFYFNGHNWLASRLRREGIAYTLIDNAFTHIANWSEAQKLVDQFSVSTLHAALDRFAKQYCPVVEKFQVQYHWSLMQVEYSTDIVFKNSAELPMFFDHVARQAVCAIKAGHIATFLGRKLDPKYQDEVGSNFNTRIEGKRLRHSMGPASIKMYDKFGLILRIETTTNDVSFFNRHRAVEQRDGQTVFKLAHLKKGIYSL